MVLMSLALMMLLISNAAFASEPRIVETEQGIVVEYTGRPDPDKDKKRANELRETVKALTSDIEYFDTALKNEKSPEKQYALLYVSCNKSKELISAQIELAEMTFTDNAKKESFINERNRLLRKVVEIQNNLQLANKDVVPDTINNKNDNIKTSDIKIVNIGTNSLGDTIFTLQTEVCNYGAPVKVWVTGAAKNWNDYEINEFLFSSVNLNKNECRNTTKTVYVEPGPNNTVHKWEIKKVDAYK